MSVCVFCDDDDGYRAWLAAHPDGFVINILRSHRPTGARVHHASCSSISGQNSTGKALTQQYVKVCDDDLAELQQWARDRVGESIPPCQNCRISRRAGRRPAPKRIEQAAPPSDLRAELRATGDGASVEAWSDDYIRFGRSWQDPLRATVRTLCGQLTPSAGQVLHATFFGPKRPDADVENLVLFNIEPPLTVAGRNGIRFEHGTFVPPAAGGAEFRYCYRYTIAPRAAAFADWRLGRPLASFNWVDLRAFTDRKRLAQVWLALSRGHAEVFMPARAPDTPFAVRVQVRPPRGKRVGLNATLVKEIFDGVICAFHAHTDSTVFPDVAERLATTLPADADEIERHLRDRRRAILGDVPRLVKPFGAVGVQWQPSDNWCVAGELLPADPVGDSWAITGELVEVSR